MSTDLPAVLRGQLPRTPLYVVDVPAGGAIPRHVPPRLTFEPVRQEGRTRWLVAGGTLPPDFPAGFFDSGEGWQVRMRGTRPQDLLKLRHLPAERYAAVRGRADDQVWLVPRLIRPVDRSRLALGWMPAQQVLRADGWAPLPEQEREVEELRALAQRLRDVAANPDPQTVLSDDEGIDLVVRILQVHYHVSRVEIVAAEWLTMDLFTEILLAAIGLQRQALTA